MRRAGRQRLVQNKSGQRLGPNSFGDEILEAEHTSILQGLRARIPCSLAEVLSGAVEQHLIDVHSVPYRYGSLYI